MRHSLNCLGSYLATLSLVAGLAAFDARKESGQRDGFALYEASGRLKGPTNGARCTVFGGFAEKLCIYTLPELATKLDAKRLPVLTEGNLRVYNGHLVVCPSEPTSSPIFMLDIQDNNLRAQDIAVMIGKRVEIAGHYDSSGKAWSDGEQAGLIVVGSMRWL
ncbi:hypothetical protein FZO89_00270 [Luteimonas viscosa]|uniref:Uncharacterized protein n=1 Tax=Luteimonas viscosa TaxID=1132694 RepID=A0A5D4XJY3_9GAMM|nr:hypothetical protein [Luteimonas viscosa]TYT24839.1 hypothetical protein FZO89_00270 [Luteimonas viscosa]